VAKVGKVYYSISEVAELTGLEPHVLRYWETEFGVLRPMKNRGGNRAYREKDIKLVFLIKKLLYHDRFTIEGARRQLSQASESYLEQLELGFEEVRALDLMRSVREDIRQIVRLVDELPGEVAAEEKRKAKNGPKGRSGRGR
jgi:DNA-binding transcriptional MerR regulator